MTEDESSSGNSSFLQRRNNSRGLDSQKGYKLVTQNMDWNSAIQYCDMLNKTAHYSHLVIIRNAEEQKAVSDYLRGQQLCSLILSCRKLDYMHLTYVICAFVMSCYSLLYRVRYRPENQFGVL